MEEIRKKQYELDTLADLVAWVDKRQEWYQHVDEETGKLVDDENTDSVLRLAAMREVRKKLMKLAGV